MTNKSFAMMTERFNRNLTTTVSADVVGYDSLIADDEAGTMCTVAVYGEIIYPFLI